MGILGKFGAALSGLGIASSVIPGGQSIAALGAIAQKIDPADMSGQIANPMKVDTPIDLYDPFAPLWGLPLAQRDADYEFARLGAGSSSALRKHFDRHGSRLDRMTALYPVKVKQLGFGSSKTVTAWKPVPFGLSVKGWIQRDIVDAEDFLEMVSQMQVQNLQHGSKAPVFSYVDLRPFSVWDEQNIHTQSGGKSALSFDFQDEKDRKKDWKKYNAKQRAIHDADTVRWFAWKEAIALENQKQAELAALQAQFESAWSQALVASPIGQSSPIPATMPATPSGPVPVPTTSPALPALSLSGQSLQVATVERRPNIVAQLLAAILAPFQ